MATETKMAKAERLARGGRVRCVSESVDSAGAVVTIFEVRGDSRETPYRVSMTPLGNHCNCEGGRFSSGDSSCSHPTAADYYGVLIDEKQIEPSDGCIWTDSGERDQGNRADSPVVDLDVRYGVPYRLGLPDQDRLLVIRVYAVHTKHFPRIEVTWDN